MLPKKLVFLFVCLFQINCSSLCVRGVNFGHIFVFIYHFNSTKHSPLLLIKLWNEDQRSISGKFWTPALRLGETSSKLPPFLSLPYACTLLKSKLSTFAY